MGALSPLALAALGCSLGVPVPVHAALPPFSWDTVPVFAETSNVTGPFDAAALATLKKFSIFVGEKGYDFPSAGFAEDKLAALARQLRELKPDIFLLFCKSANFRPDPHPVLSQRTELTWR